MHGYTAKDLGRAFRTVRENTIQIAEEIPADKYGFRPAEGSQTVAETLAHIAVTPGMQMRIHGDRMTDMKFEFFQTYTSLRMAEAAQLTAKADIVKALHNEGEEFATFLKSYKIRQTTGDRYSAAWCSQAFEKRQVKYVPS